VVPTVFDNLIIQQAVGFVKCYFTIAKILKPGWQFIPILTGEDFLPRELKMNRLVLLVEVIALFFMCSGAWGHSITVDGDDSDWSGTAPTGENSAVVSDGEFIWKDAAGDIRTKTGFSPAATSSLDITELRLTASAAALYVMVKFADLRLSEDTTCTYPIVQIGLDYADNGGASVFKDSTTLGVDLPAQVSTEAEWEYLVGLYQAKDADTKTVTLDGSNAKGALLVKAGEQGMPVDICKYNQRVYHSTQNLTGPYLMEAEIPFDAWPDGIGGSANYLSHRVHMTVACFAHGRAVSGAAAGAVQALGTPSNIMDCVSPGVNTDDEIEDNIVDFYFDVVFENDGNIRANSAPQVPAASLKVDDQYENTGVIVKSRMPVFSWDFSDSDLGDEQRSVQLQVNTSDDFSNPPWNYIAVTDWTELVYTGSSLDEEEAYYCRARVMDGGGSWSEWQKSSFRTARSALTIDTSETWLKVDWNNPFRAGTEYTRLVYNIPSGVDEQVILRIYTITGNLVKELVNERRKDDVTHTVTWDGRNEDGNLVAPGIYLAHVRIGDFSDTRKIVVTK